MNESSYLAANRSAAFADRSNRVRIEVAGPDRAKVLHNLTTHEIKRLAPGEGREAFVTSPQGKTVGWITVHALADRLLLRSDPGTAEALLAHFRKNGVFEDAEFSDISDQTRETHLVGPDAYNTAQALGLTLPEADLSISEAAPGNIPTRVIRESPTGRPGLTLIGSRQEPLKIGDLALLEPSEFDALRIEAGTPLFGQDVTASHLPQEVNRDARAISFVKGCYLGQETVARLDAIGHVKKILIGAISEDARVPARGSILQAEGKDVGVVTSSALSPRSSRGIILGYVKVALAEVGTSLTCVGGGAPIALFVHPFPLLPSNGEGSSSSPSRSATS